jgi:hypothetical protein
MHYVGSLAGLAAKALAKQVGDIRLVVYDQDACDTRGLPDGQAHAHDAASAIAVCGLRGSRTVNSVKSPTLLSTVIVPPCSWVTMS